MTIKYYEFKEAFTTICLYLVSWIMDIAPDSVKATLSQQLEEHIGEGISFYNMLVRQIQKRLVHVYFVGN